MSSARPTVTAVVVLVVLAVAQGAAAELNPVFVSPAGSTGSAPRIASDGTGNVIAIWREHDGGVSAIRTASRSSGDDWDAGRRISTPAAATEAPQLAMDRLGNAAAHAASENIRLMIGPPLKPTRSEATRAIY